MKVSPDDLILGRHKINENNNLFLVNGSEDTYIEKILTTIISCLKKIDYCEVEYFEKLNDNSEPLSKEIVSLFGGKKIIVIKNTKTSLKNQVV